MRPISNFLVAIFLAVAGFCAPPASAQYADDYKRPAMVDPAWFAGVTPISTDRPIQPSIADGPCTGTDPCVAEWGWMFGYSQGLSDYKVKYFVQAKPVPLDKGAIRKLEASAKKFPLQQSWRIQIALAYLRAARFDLFFPEINAQLATWHSSTHALMMRADTLAMLGRDDLAMADVKSAEHWGWARKYIKKGEVYYHHGDLTDVLALKAEILARMGQKREASFALSDANANVERGDRWPMHLARVGQANRTVTRLLHGWTDQELSKIDAVLDNGAVFDCATIPQEIITAKTALYRLFDVMRITSAWHDNCKRWADAELDASWLVEMALRAKTPLRLEEKVKLWSLGQDRLAHALDEQGKHLEAQRHWTSILEVGAQPGQIWYFAKKLSESFVAGRAKGLEPDALAIQALENAKIEVAHQEAAEATANRIAAENERIRQARMVASSGGGSSDPWARLDGLMSGCMGMMSDVSPVHPAYGQWRESANRCEQGREEGMHYATSMGRSDKYSEYQQIRFPWQ